MSWLSPWHWLLGVAIAAALMVGLLQLDKSRQAIGYERAVAEYTAQALKLEIVRAAIAPPIEAKQKAAQVRIRTITKTIIKEVPVYVKADDCPMSGGFRVLHDAAAYGELPNPAKVVDATSVSAQDVASTVADNYGTCKQTADRLSGLQQWVRAQAEVK